MCAPCLRSVKLNESLTLGFWESRLEYLAINSDDGCACLYLLHSINSLLSLVHPVGVIGADLCSKFPPLCRNIFKKKTLITQVHVILRLISRETLIQKGGRHNCQSWMNVGDSINCQTKLVHVLIRQQRSFVIPLPHQRLLFWILRGFHR